ncbi:MAG: lipid II flippase MurJ [Chloroflexota bacterium]
MDGIVEGDAGSSVLRGAAKAAALLTAAGLVGQVFTLIRELFVANQVGVSQDLDALLVATVAPVMLAGLLASGTAAAIVPGYVGVRLSAGRPAADRLFGATLGWTVLIGTLLSVAVVAASVPLVAVTGPGLGETARAAAGSFVPYVAPMLVLYAVGSLLAAMFQIHDRMRAVALAWMAGPIVSVIVTVALWNGLGLTALAIAMTAQQAVIVTVLIASAWAFRILPRLTLRADWTDAVRFVRHALPLTISASVLQFNLLTDRAVATLIAPGAVSALRYAEGVIRIPMNAIVPAWTAAIYPALVRASLLGDSRSFADATAGALRYILAVFVPLSLATAAMAPLVVELAYGRGAFDQRAALLTTAALVGFAPLLVLTMIQAVLTGAHNARQRGAFLMAMGFLNAFLNAVLNVGLGLLIGIAGVALSTSLTMGVIQLVNAWRLGSIEEAFALGGLLVVAARAVVASLVVAVPVGLVAWNLPYGVGAPVALGILVALTTAGMAGYIAIARLIGLSEPWIVARTLLGSSRRRRPEAR